MAENGQRNRPQHGSGNPNQSTVAPTQISAARFEPKTDSCVEPSRTGMRSSDQRSLLKKNSVHRSDGEMLSSLSRPYKACTRQLSRVMRCKRSVLDATFDARREFAASHWSRFLNWSLRLWRRISEFVSNCANWVAVVANSEVATRQQRIGKARLVHAFEEFGNHPSLKICSREITERKEEFQFPCVGFVND